MKIRTMSPMYPKSNHLATTPRSEHFDPQASGSMSTQNNPTSLNRVGN